MMYSGECEDISIIIGRKGYKMDNVHVQYQVMPHDRRKTIVKFYWAILELVNNGFTTAMAAKADWESMPIVEIQMFLKVSDQMADIYKADLNPTTMLEQAMTLVQVSKNSLDLLDIFKQTLIVQAEINSAFELSDFNLFNCFFAKELME